MARLPVGASGFDRFAVLPGASHPSIYGPRRPGLTCKIGLEKAHYSFLRGQWIQAYLREHGVSTRQHPLADALFAVDGWTGDKVISLYIGNRSYRAANGGRKHPPRDPLRGTHPPFTFSYLELSATHRFGKVHLPRRDEVDSPIGRDFGREALVY